ncbi:hypothetical protein [Streptomyces lavendulocolor]|uniref:hypothetical protein n=1 Tax=Streptomyces lavendulocolor TaxID=67316 RepID=UPI003C2B3E79
MASTPRVAVTVRNGDIVRTDDGTQRTVQGTPSSATGPIGRLMLTIRFADGGAIRVAAGAKLNIERPA